MTRLFGAKVRYLRRKHHLTQDALAQQLGGVRRAHIGNVETNSRPPSLLFVLHVAKLYVVTTHYLLRNAIPVEVAAYHILTESLEQAALPRLFGAKLRQLRRQHALAQTELATQLNLANN